MLRRPKRSTPDTQRRAADRRPTMISLILTFVFQILHAVFGLVAGILHIVL